MHLVVPPGGSYRETRRIELGARPLSIGRADACDVILDVPGVDDEHAKISEVALIAVGSDCAVGDVPLDPGCRRLVMPGDEIQVGSVVLAVDGHDPSIAPPASDGEPKTKARGPRVRVVEGQNFGDELVLADEGREYVIGRSPKADLVLEDREVSREHVKVVRRGGSILIHDQASTRGSWLGRSAVYQGSTIEWQRPRMLKIGQTVLSLELPEAMRRAAPQAQPSAPMTPPPRSKPSGSLLAAVKAGPPSSRGAGVASAAVRGPESKPADSGGPVVPVFHYEAKAPVSTPAPTSVRVVGDGAGGAAAIPDPVISQPLMMASLAAAAHSGPGGERRKAWKKTGPVIGKGGGLLLLALASIAIVGVLFVVFSLME